MYQNVQFFLLLYEFLLEILEDSDKDLSLSLEMSKIIWQNLCAFNSCNTKR